MILNGKVPLCNVRFASDSAQAPALQLGSIFRNKNQNLLPNAPAFVLLKHNIAIFLNLLQNLHLLSFGLVAVHVSPLNY